MASDIEKLIVSLEARTKSFESALNKANRTAQTQLKKIENQFKATNKKLSLTASFGGLGGVAKGGIAGLAGGLAANQVKDYADAWTLAGNKIAAAQVISGKQARSLDDLNKIATVTRSGITETVDLYAKLLKATSGVAKNEQEVATATEVVNKAFKAGGAAASEQSAGILQLSQALGSGLLQGDELRSIRENAPLIAQAIANEFQTTIGGLKQLGADGKLSVERVFKAILDAKPQIDKAFDSTNATIGDSIGLVNNALTSFVGKLSDVSGAGGEVSRFLGKDLVGAIEGLSEWLEKLKNSDGVGYLTKLAETLNWIDEIAKSIGKGVGGATGLDNVGPALGLGPDAPKVIADMFAAMDKAAPSAKAVGDLNDAFDEFRDSVKEMKPGAAAGFEELQDKLREGEIGALDAKMALDKLFGDDPMFARIKARFAPLLDALAEVKTAAAAVLGDDDRAESRKFQADAKTYGDFIGGRDADAKRDELQKQIDDRADKIKEAAEKIGIAMTDAAAKIQAAKEIAAEDVAKSAGRSSSNSADLIKEFEGFRSKPYWDVNAYRAGYGSDTVELADGTIVKITKGMSVSVTDANRDLVRRIGEFQDGIKGQIGADTFNGMDENQQAALTSIAYNYGSLPQRIVDAIKTGNEATVVQAIRGLGSDNSGINRDRRNTEADMFLGGAPSGVQKAVKGQDKFNERLSDTQLQIDLLNKEAAALGLVNPLLNDYGYAQTKAEIQQRLLNDAMDNGVEITPEYAARIAELAEKYATADASRNQMQAGVEKLSDSMAESSALGKNVLGGFVQDLRDGKTATEALSNALNKVADKLLEIALSALFDGTGGVAGGGILGGIFSFLGFSKGGYTGPGGKNQPAGIVHKGEVVFSQDDVKRFGGAGNLDRIRRGYANGGIVGGVPSLSSPSIPNKADGNGNMHITVGVSADSVGNLTPFVESVAQDNIRKASPGIVQASVQRAGKETKKNMGGYIASAQSRQM